MLAGQQNQTKDKNGKVYEQEEQFLLRVKDSKLAEKLLSELRKDKSTSSLKLQLQEGDRQGSFVVDGEEYSLSLLDLPTLVELYKTYDDAHLVKIADLHQMLLVDSLHKSPAPCEESVDGVTPPFNNARRRHFKENAAVEPDALKELHANVLRILGGGAPQNMEFVDVEEEYVIDEKGHGSWQPLK